ncbi:copper transporter 6-like [Humulus lupulus]|uniref:copper transporter 6-like n=1 Tax=Humulus lupulus TaxID=3486 RepID=UPI002B4117CE|nr:copper transporter 6-like [Humulus lupulus]
MSESSDMTSNHGFWSSPATAFNGTGPASTHFRGRIPMHMTFFWGHVTEILFRGWPGSNSVMYGLSLVFVFTMAVVVEWLTHSDLVRPGSADLTASLLRTVVHTVRSGMSYLVMLAVMSFNGGVFIAALCGHTIGFFVFRTRALLRSAESGSGSARPHRLSM